MATVKKKINIFESEEGMQIKEALELMAMNSAYKTDDTYSANTEKYPNNLTPFVDKHMNYLNSHPDVNPTQYISNLRLMTRFKSTQN